MNTKRWSVLELVVSVLFLCLSLVSILLPDSTFISKEACVGLYLTGIINAVFIVIYLILRIVFRGARRHSDIQAGILLFILYNTVPLLLLIRTMMTTSLSLICITGASILFIKHDGKPFPLNKFKSVFSAMVLIIFSLIFIGRGAVIIAAWAQGGDLLTETAVSIADVIISLIWLAAGTACFRHSKSEGKLLLPVFIQAVLLFVILIIYMLLNPLISAGTADPAGVIVISVMAVFFVIPAVWLIKMKMPADN